MMIAENSKQPPITISNSDFDQLTKLSGASPKSAVTEFLEHELDRARVVGRVPDTVVRLGSRVMYQDVAKDAPSEITLVLPHEADIKRKRVSVLTPVGAALIGLAEGQRITFVMPWGRARTLAVLKLKPLVH
jgi:regulator of nucleoside diphosphate kinase